MIKAVMELDRSKTQTINDMDVVSSSLDSCKTRCKQLRVACAAKQRMPILFPERTFCFLCVFRLTNGTA
jgi:hypothetical protein